MLDATSLSLRALEAWDPDAQGGRLERRFLCPFCGDGKPRDSSHRSISANMDTGAWQCHRCHASGKLVEFRGKPVGEESLLGLPVVRERQIEIPKHLDKMNARYVRRFPRSPASVYLHSRGILYEVASAAGCGYCERWDHWEKPPDGGDWKLAGMSRRVTFPVYNREGILVAVQGRAMSDDSFGPRVLTRGPKSAGIFAAPGALSGRMVLITEAPIDALSLTACGWPAVATLGTSWPDWLPRACARKQVFLAFDADEAGDEAAHTLAGQLAPTGARVDRLRPNGAKDWNELLIKVGAWDLREALTATLGE